MKVNFIENVHPNIQKLRPYETGKTIAALKRELGLESVIKLASNENPLGPSPAAVEAARASLASTGNYPDPAGYDLRQALAKKWQVSPEQLTLGNGSDSILGMICQVFASDGDEVLVSEHGFASFIIYTLANRATPVPVKEVNWRTDLTAVAQHINAKTKIIFLANPNNPTGTYFSDNELEEFLHKVPEHVIVVLDEAYFEYVDAPDYPDTIKLQKSFSNLITTRTFSKAYGLAGFRVGYSISHADIADLLNRVRSPFNVTTPSLAAATAALGDHEHLQKSIAVNEQGMQQLTSELAKLDLTYIPSVANFITVDMERNAMEINQALLNEGVIVRPLRPYNMPKHLRLSIGTESENARLIATLQRIL